MQRNAPRSQADAVMTAIAKAGSNAIQKQITARLKKDSAEMTAIAAHGSRAILKISAAWQGRDSAILTIHAQHGNTATPKPRTDARQGEAFAQAIMTAAHGNYAMVYRMRAMQRSDPVQATVIA